MTPSVKPEAVAVLNKRVECKIVHDALYSPDYESHSNDVSLETRLPEDFRARFLEQATRAPSTNCHYSVEMVRELVLRPNFEVLVGDRSRRKNT